MTYKVTTGAIRASAICTTAAIPCAARPRPRRSGGTHTPCTWQACGVTEPTSALKMTRPSSIRANERPALISSITRVRYAAPPSIPIGETPTSSVNMSTLAGSRISISPGRTARTSGSAGTSGSPEMASTGCAALTSRGRPQCGESRPHSSWTVGAGPTIDEQRRPCSRARAANAATAAGVAATGTRLAPE